MRRVLHEGNIPAFPKFSMFGDNILDYILY